MTREITIALSIALLSPLGCSDPPDDEPDTPLDMRVEDMPADMDTLADLVADDMLAPEDSGSDAPPDLEPTPDMISCAPDTYLSEDGSCQSCPSLEWTCRELEETITFDPAQSSVSFTLAMPGYERGVLYGSASSAQSGGMMASPFQVEALDEMGELRFDLIDYAQSSEVLLLSLELFSACDASRRTRLYIRWLPEEEMLERALCL